MSIPASRIVTINPSAIGAGGNPLAMNTLLVVSGPQRTIGVQQFGSAAEVGSFYGLTSPEYAFAVRYFLGYDGAYKLPTALFTVQSPATPQTAILRGGSVAGMTLTQLKAITGNLVVTVNGTQKTVNVNFSAANSFSDAAAMLTDTTSFVGNFNEQQQRFELNTITTGAAATIGYASGPTAAAIKLDAAGGAQFEGGRAVATDSELMTYAMSRTQNFGVIAHSTPRTLDQLKSMASWVTTQNSRFAYVGLDTSADGLTANNSASFGAWLQTTNQNGTIPYYGNVAQAAALCGGIASIDFTRTNGRRNIMFMKQSGVEASVVDSAAYTALLSNGYTFYASFATANDNFTFNVNGAIAGQFEWADNYINQIYMNAQFQLALVTMLTSYGFIPYNSVGLGIHRAAVGDTISEMLNFGAIVPLVDPKALSDQQKSIINSQVGYEITPTLLSKGWAIDIKIPSAQVRGNRGSFPFTFFYTDGGSVQSVNMASINIQ